MALHPSPVHTDDVDVLAESIAASLYQVSQTCVPQRPANEPAHPPAPAASRWERLLQDRDDARVWRAIDWSGRFRDDQGRREARPSDEEFRAHFQHLYNQMEDAPVEDEDYRTYIPSLDDPIAEREVRAATMKLKGDKACGPDGISPAIFKMMSIQWILCIVTLFNNIFLGGVFPRDWCFSKMSMIHKKGSKLQASNYRGINIINSISKVYDQVLYNRLNEWFSPYPEQAGCQKGRSCIEHVLTLRLLCDFAKRKKRKLYVSFIDFSTAYDCVSRSKLFTILRRLGCGAVMLAALMALYTVTHSIIGTAVIAASIGLKQGSPTSVILFIIYINDLIQLVKSSCPLDGFLTWLHMLVLMDDTVFVSTTRGGMRDKLVLLQQYCRSHKTKVNNTKTKFFVVNGTPEDREPFELDLFTVSWCDSYVYLGSVFTSDGAPSSAIRQHAVAKEQQAIKFVTFVRQNNDVPFFVKLRVFNACVMSSILYGCETWLQGDLRPITRLYNMCIKAMLGIRNTTCNDLCYMELGLPPLKALVTGKQRAFVKGLWQRRENLPDDPWAHAFNIARGARNATSRYLEGLLSQNIDDVSVAMEELRQSIRTSPSSRRAKYATLNPSMSVHRAYTQRIA